MTRLQSAFQTTYQKSAHATLASTLERTRRPPAEAKNTVPKTRDRITDQPDRSHVTKGKDDDDDDHDEATTTTTVVLLLLLLLLLLPTTTISNIR